MAADRAEVVQAAREKLLRVVCNAADPKTEQDVRDVEDAFKKGVAPDCDGYSYPAFIEAIFRYEDSLHCLDEGQHRSNLLKIVRLFLQYGANLARPFPGGFTPAIAMKIAMKSMEDKPLKNMLSSTSKIINNARILAQASRTQTGPLFFRVPAELQVKIAALTGDIGVHSEEVSVTIATQYLKRVL